MSDIRFESKAFVISYLISGLGGSWLILEVVQRAGLHKTLVQARSIIVDRNPIELEFIVSRWIIKTHTFVASWGKFGPSL